VKPTIVIIGAGSVVFTRGPSAIASTSRCDRAEQRLLTLK
jgi:hypothetical protein